MNPMEEVIEKDTKKEDVDTGEMINEKTIKLDEYDSNITIEEGGEYKEVYGNQEESRLR